MVLHLKHYIQIILFLILFISNANGEENNTKEYISPLQLAINEMGLNRSLELTNTLISQKLSSVESPTSVIITIEQSGLLDDSIAAIQTVFVFSLNNDIWTLSSKTTKQRCQRG
ncbi:MAG: hypothetical protein ACE1S7_08715, partial [Candidatus Tisiphia sp.]